MGDTDFRALVSEAYEQAEAAGGDSGVAEAAPDAQPAGGSLDASKDGSGETSGGDSGGGSVREEPATPRKDGRDENGRFAPKAKDTAPTAVKTKAGKEVTPTQSSAGVLPPLPGSDPSTQPPAAEPAETIRPPASLTPAEREHFSKAPPEVQKAFARLDREVRQTMQEAAPARKFMQEAQQALGQYQQFAQQMGTTPLGLAARASQVAHTITTGAAPTVAKTIADLIRSRPDVDVKLIAAALDGQLPDPMGGQQRQQPGQFDPETIIRQAEERVMQRFQGQRQQQLQATVQQEIAAFEADPKNEWADDAHIRSMMSAIMANHRGPQPLGISDAYQRAIWASPDHRDILQKRQAAEAAKASTASTQQARLAASSVKSTPSTGASQVRKPQSHRDIVADAWETLDGR